jgi:ubiquinone biosynthesis protein
MNWIQFGRLIHSIYAHDGNLPDLDRIEKLGLLAVKLGQVHALRSDFLEAEKCEHLALLFRRNSALPAEKFLKLLTDSEGTHYLNHFDMISADALASASVGQVHRAKLVSGEEVVIKAIKRNARHQFKKDVASLRRLFRLATFIYPPMKRAGDPVGILDDIEEYTLSELDLRNEVEGQRELRLIAESAPEKADLSRLKFAHVYESMCNSNVMVSKFVRGPSLDELLDAKALKYEQLLDLFKIHGYFMFCRGIFHGDLHPGNVLVSDANFYFIDTGYIGRVSAKTRISLFDFFCALSEADYSRCALTLNRMCGAPLKGVAFDTFAQKFHELYADFKDSTVAEVSLTRKMMETIKLAARSGMNFDKGIFAIIRSLMYLDGMVLRCHPQAVLLRDMRPVLRDFAKMI